MSVSETPAGATTIGNTSAIQSQAPCPCGSNRSSTDCCLPYLQSDKYPSTAEQLMRSRFSAYTLRQYDYLMKTWHPSSAPASEAQLQANCQNTQWLKLVVHQCQQGATQDSQGWVSFSAYFEEDGKQSAIHERSFFQKSQGLQQPSNHWLYVSGESPSRKDACICGSGKKFKRCCLAT